MYTENEMFLLKYIVNSGRADVDEKLQLTVLATTCSVTFSVSFNSDYYSRSFLAISFLYNIINHISYKNIKCRGEFSTASSII